MKKLILIGGGNLKNHENKLIHEYMISCSKKAKPSLLYVPIASYNSDNNIASFIDCMSSFNVNVSIFENLKSLENADIVYIGGGHTDYLINELKEKNMLQDFIKMLDEKIVVGLSAGAIFWFKKYMSDCYAFDCGSGIVNYRLMDGIGYFDAYCCPHYNVDGLICFNDCVDDNLALALENNTAIAIDDNGIELLKDNKNNAIYFFHKGTMFLMTEKNKEVFYKLLVNSVK